MQARQPLNTAATYSDAYLQEWSDVYVQRGVRNYGVHLEFFLIDPQRILDRIDSGRMLRLDQMSAPRDCLAGAQ